MSEQEQEAQVGGLFGQVETVDDSSTEQGASAESAPADAPPPEQTGDQHDNDTTENEKKWADKFTSPEALEEDYRKQVAEVARLSKERADAPDEYAAPNVDVQVGDDELLNVLNTEDPRYTSFSEAAKKANLSQDQFEAIVAHVARGEYEAQTATLAKEQEVLGPKGAERVGAVANWLKESLGDKLFNEVAGDMSGTAAQIMALEKLQKMTTGNAGANLSSPAERVSLPSKDEVQRRKADPRYGQDEAFTNETLDMDQRLMEAGQ